MPYRVKVYCPQTVHNKIKLLHLITGLGCGGAEKMVYQLCKYADRDRFEISVISIDETDYFLPQLESLQVNVNMLELQKTPISMINGIFKLNKLLRQNQIQVIHAHLFHGMVMACMVKILNPKLKIIWTSHSSQMISISRGLVSYVSRFLRNCDIILQEHLKLWYNASISSVILNGVEIPLQTNSIEKFEVFTFISVGSLRKVKNHIFLIDLFSKIDNFDYRLLIVGSGPEEKKIQNRIDKLDLSDKVTILGHRDDVSSLLQKSHCFLLPSLWEGLPLAILESACAKLPIISNSITSIEKLILEDEGYVVPLDQFKDTIQIVVDNYADAEVKANRFYDHVKNEYSISMCMSNHEKLYQMVLNA